MTTASRTSQPRPDLPRRKRGFTLVEILAVLAVVSVMAGLLLPAILAARRRSVRALAQAEVRHLETAWRGYHARYGRWPNGIEPDVAYPVTGTLARLLMGIPNEPDNPDELVFFSFRRLDRHDNPVNPWGMQRPDPTTDYFFYVQFDAREEDRIQFNRLGAAETVRQPVVVWTLDPNLPTGDTSRIVASWR